MVKVQMPCLITALGEMNKPRYMTPGGIFNAFREKQVTVLTRQDIDIQDQVIGLKGSPTKVAKSWPISVKPAGMKVTDLDSQEAAEAIVEKLKEKFIF